MLGINWPYGPFFIRNHQFISKNVGNNDATSDNSNLPNRTEMYDKQDGHSPVYTGRLEYIC